ncbi:MAG TPA: hypothetical protein VHC22_32490 [Pirellulales bacterium]|nr:hypothetical protein [Pirellulales bacterium]
MAAEERIHQAYEFSKQGTRLRFNHGLQAWFPIEDERAAGPAEATLLADAVWEKNTGLRTRAIEIRLGQDDEEAIPHVQPE